MRIILITLIGLSIALKSFSQGSIDIDTNIQMGVVGTEHVKITSSAFSVHNGVGSTPLIYGDYGSGNVGIGTKIPTQKLHVVGGGYFSDVVTFNGTASRLAKIGAISFSWDTPGSYDYYQYLGISSQYRGSWGDNLTIASTDNIDILLDANDNNGTSKFSVRTDRRANSSLSDKILLSVVSNGQVGIGTNNPEKLLHIESPSSPFIQLENTDTYLTVGQVTGEILFRQNDTSSGGTGTAGIIRTISRNRPDNSSFFGNISRMGFFIGNSNGGLGTPVETLTISQPGRVGVLTINPSYSLHVNGSAGKPGGGSWSNSSDKRLKKNISKIQNGLEAIEKLNPVKYEWINPDLHGGRSSQFGFLAQDVERHFPDWIDEHEPHGDDRSLFSNGDKVKNLTLPFDFDALLISAVKELSQEVKSLKLKINEQALEITDLRSEIKNKEK